MPEADALALVEAAAARLWTPEGADALAYLHGPGTGRRDDPRRPPRVDARGDGPDPGGGPRLSAPSGWSSRGSPGAGWRWSRSASPRGGGRSMPKPSATRPASSATPAPRRSAPAARWSIAEGEFDALLLGQELPSGTGRRRDAGIGARPGPDPASSGGCWPPPRGSSRPTPTRPGTRPPRRGPPGRGASGPPRGKDWTEVHARRGSTASATCGEGSSRPWPRLSWEELASWRWGPAASDPEAGSSSTGPTEAGCRQPCNPPPMTPRNAPPSSPKTCVDSTTFRATMRGTGTGVAATTPSPLIRPLS